MLISELTQLNEAINITRTEYGTNENADNGIIKPKGISVYYTDTIINDKRFRILLGRVAHDKNIFEVTFMVFQENPNYDYASPYSYTFDRQEIKNAFGVFGRITWVALQIADYVRASKIVFSGLKKGLASLYTRIMSNKSFLKELEKFGWRFDGKMDVDFKLERINK